MIKERIIQLIEKKGIPKEEFYIKIGMTSASFRGNAKQTPLNSTAIENILSEVPDVNPEWLLTGKGNMLKTDINMASLNIGKKTKGIPLIPISAMAGYTTEDVQVMDYEFENIYDIPDFENKGVKFLIRASGSSMYPKYSNGDILACRPINDMSFFQWGKVYVLDTDQGPLVKRLFPCEDDIECLECRSDNKEHYPPFRLKKASVRKVSIVVGVVRLE